MDNNGAVKSTQHRRLGARGFSKTQAGLVLGFVVVGVVAAFGVGFIVGMWYQANEHITPYEARPASATEAQEAPAKSQGMTFYSTLTTRDAGTPASATAAVPATKPAAKVPDAASQPPTRSTTPAPPTKAAERLAASSAAPTSVSSALPGSSAVTKRETSPPQPVASPPQAARLAPDTAEATSRLPVRTVTPAPPSTGERAPTLGSAAPPAETAQTVAALSPSRPPGAAYSVQVGSFRTPEPAEQLRSRLAQKGYPARVQVSVLPGKGTWYRVRVGPFPDRLGADQTARRLTTQERLSTVVAAEEGK